MINLKTKSYRNCKTKALEFLFSIVFRLTSIGAMIRLNFYHRTEILFIACLYLPHTKKNDRF